MALVPFPGSAAPVDPYRDDDDRESPPDLDSGRMSFLEHLEELRKRLLVSVIALAVGFLVSFAVVDKIFAFIMRPLQQTLAPGVTFIYTEPTEAFFLYMKVAAIAGVFLAAPVMLWQLWLFIAPGLYIHEKKMAIPFVALSTICFLSGGLFSHYVVFPAAWRFFGSFSTDFMQFTPKIEPAFSLYSWMLLAFGVVFQMPTLVLFLARMGLVTARWLWRNIKYAILVIFIIAAVVTPTADVVVQTMMAVPMIALYLVSILIAWIVAPRRARNA